MGGKPGGGGGSTTTVQKADPWSGIQPQLLQAVADTQKLYNQGNAGGVPDVDAYQSALSKYNAGGAPNTGGFQYTPGMTLQDFSRQNSALAGDFDWNSKFQDFANGKANPNGPAPTQDQFMKPGTGTGSPLAPNYFPGNTVAQFAPQQQQAIDATTQRATQGSPVNQANQGLLTDTLKGNYLDPNSNPWLKSTYDQAAKSVTGSINGSFGQGGRYGSGLNQQALGNTLGNLATDIYGGNYTKERAAQGVASQLAPQAANTDYTDLSALANAGQTAQGQNQANINDQIARYNYGQGQPMQQVQNYLGLLQGTGVPNQTSTTTPNGGNSSMQSLGAGLGLLGGLNSMGGLSSLIPSTTSLMNSGAPAALVSMASKFSDIRLKHDIKFIDNVAGINLYSFRYDSKPKNIYIGVMAHEVYDSHPDAVDIKNGYLCVDYSQLPVPFRRVH